MYKDQLLYNTLVKYAVQSDLSTDPQVNPSDVEVNSPGYSQRVSKIPEKASGTGYNPARDVHYHQDYDFLGNWFAGTGLDTGKLTTVTKPTQDYAERIYKKQSTHPPATTEVLQRKGIPVARAYEMPYLHQKGIPSTEVTS